MFGERGYQAATVGAITSRANIAHGTFYLYYRNKQDAYAAVMTSITDELYREADLSAVADDPRAALEATIRSFLEVFVEHRLLWRSLLEASFTNPEIQAVWLSLRSRFVERIEHDICALRAAGAVRDLDAPLVANALGGMVEWAATTQFVLESGPAAGRSVGDTAAVLADLWWSAVFADAPALAVRT